MFKYICFQTVSYNFQVTSYSKGIDSIYETDFNQFYTIWDGSKYAVLTYPFCCSLRNTIHP